jgi:hypothetical protein
LNFIIRKEKRFQTHSVLSTLEEFREKSENHPLCPFCPTPSFHSVGKETPSVCARRKIVIRARLAVPTYLLALRREFQRLPTKVSLALGQCFKIPPSPQATLLIYETFFDYFSVFLLHHSALKKNAADRARIPLKRFRFTQFSEAEARKDNFTMLLTKWVLLQCGLELELEFSLYTP